MNNELPANFAIAAHGDFPHGRLKKSFKTRDFNILKN